MKTSSRRNALFSLCLFLAVGALVLLAHLRNVPDYPTEEPAGIVQKRLDRQNNAFYVLQQAYTQLPPKPPALRLCDEQTMPYAYQPEEFSLGALLDIKRPDDDPLLLQYLSECRPSLDLAITALDKPWFLTERSRILPREHNQKDNLHVLPSLLLAQAALQDCSDDPSTDACQTMLHALDLIRILNADGKPWRLFGEPQPALVIQKARPDHLKTVSDGIAKLRASWIPPEVGIANELRNNYLMTAREAIGDARLPTIEKYFVPYQIASMKKQMFAHEQNIRKAACMTLLELDKGKSSALAFCPYQYPYANSCYFTVLDGLALAVALEQYNRDHHQYPDAATDLVPQYLAQLPKSSIDGNDYLYKRKGYWYLLYVTYKPELYGRTSPYLVIHIPKGVTSKALDLEH